MREDADKNLEFGPEFKPYLVTGMRNSLWGSLLLLPFIVALIPCSGVLFGLMLILAYWVLFAIGMANAVVSQKRSRYRIAKDRIVFEARGIGGRQQIEIEFDKIAQITIKRPWWEKRFFETATVTIEAAGDSGIFSRFRNIADPDAVAALIEQRMRHGGFRLRRERIVCQERPSLGASVASVVQPFVVLALFAMAIVGLTFLGNAIGAEGVQHFIDIQFGRAERPADLGGPTGLANAGWRTLFALVLSGGAFVAGMLLAAVRVMMMRQRTYTLYDDVIDYEQRTWSHVRKFIPLENVTDVRASQGVLQRVFKIANVSISCQGATGTIDFAWVPKGLSFAEKIQRLLDRDDVAAVEIEEASAGDGLAFESGLRMSMARLLLPHLLVALSRAGLRLALIVGIVAGLWHFFPELLARIEDIETYRPWFYGAIGAVVGVPLALRLLVIPGLIAEAKATTYHIERKGIRKSYSLLAKEDTRFTTDKINAVIVWRDVWDRIFRTTTIDFRSVGSKTPLRMQHVSTKRLDLPDILRHVGFASEEPRELIRARYSLGRGVMSYTQERLPGILAPLVFLGVFASFVLLLFSVASDALDIRSLLIYVPVGFAIMGVVLAWSLVWELLRQWEASSNGTYASYSDHVILRRGRLKSVTFLAGHEGIKHVESLLQPFGGWGEICVHAGAGARIRLHYLDDPFGLHDRLDARLYQSDGPSQPSPILDTTVLSRHSPVPMSAWLSALPFFFACLVMPPLLLVLPLGLKYYREKTKRTYYDVERSRLVKTTGIWWRHKLTVLRTRVDNVTTRETVLSRLANSGDILVSTAGSSVPELILAYVEHPDAVAQSFNGLEASTS